MERFKGLGGRAVTIAGGGDPTVHKDFDEIIGLISNLGIKIGLVTNGIRLIKFNNISKLTWCRISLSYCNPMRADWINLIHEVNIDWAFSYVYTSDFELCQKAIRETKDLNITHFRVVSDINNPKPLPKFEDDDKVLYQPRVSFVHGAKKCYIALMKPYLDTDGFYYPCCGVQFARQNGQRKMQEDMRMGDNLEVISKAQIPFDGSLCTKCYYDDYNKLMDKIINSESPIETFNEMSIGNEAELDHLDFL